MYIRTVYVVISTALLILLLMIPDESNKPGFQKDYREFYEATWAEAGDNGLSPEKAAELDRRAAEFRSNLENMNLNSHIKSLYLDIFLAHLGAIFGVVLLVRHLRQRDLSEVLFHSSILFLLITYFSGFVSSSVLVAFFLFFGLKNLKRTDDEH